MLSAEHLRVVFGRHTVLKDVSFSLPAAGCLGVAGPNGSGKSTLLAVLSGALSPSGGRCVLPAGRPAFVPQSPALFEDLTVAENLALFAKLSGRKTPYDTRRLPLQTGDFLEKRVSRLSGGMKKRVSIAAALLGDPCALLLDEPCAALDIVQRDALLELVDQCKKQIPVVYVGHDYGELSRVADTLLLLKDGHCLCCAPRADFPSGADGLENAVRGILADAAV
ncbi:MAG: ABC transporter ATP-binding protein [Oscillospiraceae bacterium]|nr:ABC transporter ATP-binding protein [Oscillospiraceae bacterium]